MPKRTAKSKLKVHRKKSAPLPKGAPRVQPKREPLSEEMRTEYEAVAVDFTLGFWPQCPSSTMATYLPDNKYCCIDEVDGCLWRCADCNTIYRKPNPTTPIPEDEDEDEKEQQRNDRDGDVEHITLEA